MPPKKPVKAAPKKRTPVRKPPAHRKPPPRRGAPPKRPAPKAPAAPKAPIVQAPDESKAGAVVVDGSNVAMQRMVNGKPTIDNIKLVHGELTKLGYQPVIFVDASLRHRLPEAEKIVFEKWYTEGFVTQAPKGVPGDEAILEFATRKNAPVLSNDTYEGYEQRYPWVSDRSRRIPFNIVHDELILYLTSSHAKARQAHSAQPPAPRPATKAPAPAATPEARREEPTTEPRAPNPERDAFAEKLQEAFRRASPTGEPVLLDVFLRKLREIVPHFRAQDYGYGKPSALIQAFPELFALDRRSDHGDVSELNGPAEWPVHVCRARR